MSAETPVRVRLRYAALDTFIDKFAPNVTRGGVFLASREPRAVGDVFPFEIQLAGGEVALAGEGKVTWVKPFDPAAPHKPYGMGVQFIRLDPPSRATLNQMLARKVGGQSGPVRTLQAEPRVGRPSGVNGALGARVDTNVDLAAELGVDEASLRRATDRRWLAANRAAGEVDELELLLKPEPIEPVSIAQALADLPRLLDSTRRRTTTMRPLGEQPAPRPAGDSPSQPTPPATASDDAPAASNGAQ